jgi:two-component system phosphate regulon response regulator PhoB
MNHQPQNHEGTVASTAPCVLVVEGDANVALLLRYNLAAVGYRVECIERGDAARARLSKSIPDLVILDWNLPEVCGLEICRWLRQRPLTRNLPIVILTARREESELLLSFSAGADDYVVKPFSVTELLARIRGLLRRSKTGPVNETLCVGDIELDRSTRRVRRGAREVHLGPQGFCILEHMLERPGRAFARRQLQEMLGGEPTEVAERAVNMHISRLRKALRQGQESDPIRSVRGVGYAFDEAIEKGCATGRSDTTLAGRRTTSLVGAGLLETSKQISVATERVRIG